MIKFVKDHLLEDGYKPSMLQIYTSDPFQLVKNVPHMEEVREANPHYYLHERAIHVFSEAQRVYDFKAVCMSSEIVEDSDRIGRLGEIMDESHVSCYEKYDCTTDELDTLVGMAKNCGAFGAKLNGRGWGGHTVSLVRRSNIDVFISIMLDFYPKD